MSLDAWQTWSASGNIADLSHGAARLLPLIDHNLRHHGGEGVVGSGTELLAAMWCETQLLHHEAGEMLRALERGRVDTLLLKGAALTFLDYPEPSLRPMADVDVLVRPGDIRRADRHSSPIRVETDARLPRGAVPVSARDVVYQRAWELRRPSRQGPVAGNVRR